MSLKVLYILPSYNKFGGTPKKTMDLIKYSDNSCFLYVWTNAYAEDFKQDFEEAGAKIFEGNHGSKVRKHVSEISKIISNHNIDIIQSQFFFGELLATFVKIFNPKIKLIIAFVGSASPSGYKRHIMKLLYHKTDAFVYISNYVRQERSSVYPRLKKANGKIIYNGTTRPENAMSAVVDKKHETTMLCVSGLSKIKNIQILIDVAVLLFESGYREFEFLIAGDGPQRENFEKQIQEKGISNHVTLLGYQKDIGDLYQVTDIFVHPCYIEGFGIAVAEAMLEGKPIVAANAGALPELIVNEETGLLVDPFDAAAWAKAIVWCTNNRDQANRMGSLAQKRAQEDFSVHQFVNNYNELYQNLA